MIMKKNSLQSPITCMIGSSAVLEGTFRAKEATRIEGTINGDIIIEGILTLGDKAVVNGNIISTGLVTAGKVVGNIKVANNIEILGSASIKGDIECATMVMDENAYFEGTCKMNRSENKDKEKKKA